MYALICSHINYILYKMRYYILLQNNVNNIPIFGGTKEYHVYNDDVYNTQLLFTKQYDKVPSIKKYYNKLLMWTHPFEKINKTITSSFTTGDLKITNAFMKIYEYLLYIDKYLPNTGRLKMYDIAGAPGMFILGTEYYLKKFKPDVTLDWRACSLVDNVTNGKGALPDAYTLFGNNRDRFQPCDVTNQDDIKRCICEGKFQLVTGDIGVYHEDSYYILQEEVQLDIEWGQMILALNLVDTRGLMFLKMYTFVTEESEYLLDILTEYFEEVALCKPYTSRIINDESYIICTNRNDKNCTHLPLKRPILKSYISKNEKLITTFEKTRGNYRVQLTSVLARILESEPKITLKDAKKNETFKIFSDEIQQLLTTFYDLT